MTCRPRSLLLALLFSICSISSSRATWNKIYQFTFANPGRVSACYFFNADTGLIAFHSFNQEFKVLRTTDGGVTWNSVATPMVGGGLGFVWFNEFWFKNKLEGWAAFKADGTSVGGGVWHTTDGGLTWTETSMKNQTMSVRETRAALIISSNDTKEGLNFSTNNGLSFDIPHGRKRNCFAFANDTDGMCTGYDTTGFSITNDGGLNWHGPAVNILNECWGAYALRRGTGTYVCVDEDGHNYGNQSRVYRSDDYGKTWKAINLLNVQTMGDIEGDDSIVFVQNTGYITGTLPGLYRSTDLGLNWTAIGGPNQSFDARIGVVPNTCGQIIYAFDSTGGVWKTTDGGDGFIPGGGGSLTVTPLSLFDKDTIYCGDTLTKILTIDRKGCAAPVVQSYTFSGTDAASYKIESDSTVRVKFSPQHEGLSSAALDIAVSDGSTVTIPLAGVRNDVLPPISILLANVSTDTLGGTVRMPITITGLHKRQDVSFVMHYTGDLDHLGTTSPTGAPLDVAGQQWSGRAQLQVYAYPDTIVGYASFNVYTDSSFSPRAIFDSIVLVGAPSCPYVFVLPDTGLIGIPRFCGDEIISRFLRTGGVTVSVRPNPTTDGVLISAQQDLGVTRVIVRNAVGTVVEDRTLSIGPAPTKLTLPNTDGFYDIELLENDQPLHLHIIRAR